MHEANGHGANIRFISYNMHSFTDIASVVIPSKRANETVRVRGDVVEVDVLATVVEVVVHDDGSGTSCSGTWV